MPTVLRLPGLRVTIYPNDHRPAHVHVIGNGNEAVFELNCQELNCQELNCPEGTASLRENFGFAQHELNAIQRALQEHMPQLCQDWKGIHGYA